jgi:hypothetical protein
MPVVPCRHVTVPVTASWGGGVELVPVLLSEVGCHHGSFRLNHPDVGIVHDVVEYNGAPPVVMAFVPPTSVVITGFGIARLTGAARASVSGSS